MIFKRRSGPPFGRTRPAASSDSGLGMAGVVALDAFRQKPLATALASAGEGGATAFGAHAGAKTVLAFAGSLGCLVSSFHKTEKQFRCELRAVTLGMGMGLSIGEGPGDLIASCQCSYFLG